MFGSKGRYIQELIKVNKDLGNRLFKEVKEHAKARKELDDLKERVAIVARFAFARAHPHEHLDKAPADVASDLKVIRESIEALRKNNG